MATISNLDKYLYNVRRIEEHREETAVKELQKLYKQMIQDLRAKLGNVYADYADPDTGELTYTQLHKSGTDARLLEEIAAHVSSVSEQEAKLIKETVEQTYTNCYSGMIQAVESAVDDDSLATAFASVSAAKPQALKAAVDNPVHGLTLSSQLEKNRADIIYTIKQTVGVGLSMGDRYDTMARRIQQSLIGDKKKAAGSYAKAIRIVRTEAHRCREQGNLDAAVSLNEKLQPAGVTMMKTWHTMKDNRVRPQHRYKTKSGWKYSKKGKYNHEKMEGVSVPINEKFKLPSGAEADAPGKSGVAGEDINCRCFLSYTVEAMKEKSGLQGTGADDTMNLIQEGKGYVSAVENEESKIYADSVETAVLLDSKGKVLFRESSGASSYVKFTNEQAAMMKGATLTHNHPSGSTFSSADISILTKQELKTIRATGKERTYQLSRNKNAIDDSFVNAYEKAHKTNKKITDTKYRKLKKQYESGGMNPVEFQNAVSELNKELDSLDSNWFKENAKDYGYRYSVFERK